jgi:HEPN domain-containing protein
MIPAPLHGVPVPSVQLPALASNETPFQLQHGKHRYKLVSDEREEGEMKEAMPRSASLGNYFVHYADLDLLAFAYLWQGGLRVLGYYHAVQAIEKYLKALALSIIDPDGTVETPSTSKWLRTHDLSKLTERCEKQHPYYGQDRIKAILKRFTEFDQLARYPWVKQELGNGFTSADQPIYVELITHLRKDIPIQLDDYPLGIQVRGFHQGHPEYVPGFLSDLAPAVAALRTIFPDIKDLVRW